MPEGRQACVDRRFALGENDGADGGRRHRLLRRERSSSRAPTRRRPGVHREGRPAASATRSGTTAAEVIGPSRPGPVTDAGLLDLPGSRCCRTWPGDRRTSARPRRRSTTRLGGEAVRGLERRRCPSRYPRAWPGRKPPCGRVVEARLSLTNALSVAPSVFSPVQSASWLNTKIAMPPSL